MRSAAAFRGASSSSSTYDDDANDAFFDEGEDIRGRNEDDSRSGSKHTPSSSGRGHSGHPSAFIPGLTEKTGQGQTYDVDLHTGQKVIRGSKRPDGTYRKDIRVRPGYVPIEEQAAFRSRRLGNNNSDSSSSGPPGWSPVSPGANYIPGLGSSATSSSVVPAKAKAKAKKKKNPVSATSPAISPSTSPASGLASSQPLSTASAAAVDDTIGQLRDLEITGASWSSSSPSQKLKNDSRKANKTDDKANDGAIDDAVDAGAGPMKEKKLRNLKKKFKEIEALEVKISDGKISSEDLLPEQLEKLKKKGALKDEIDRLEKEA